jgi:hypothetical protein
MCIIFSHEKSLAIPCFTDSGFYRFRLIQFHVLQIPAFTIPGFTDSGFYNFVFYRFGLLQFRVFALPIPFPIPFRDSPFRVLQVAYINWRYTIVRVTIRARTRVRTRASTRVRTRVKDLRSRISAIEILRLNFIFLDFFLASNIFSRV